MSRSRPIVAVYPGSFDPVTNGHLDVIRRASRLCDRLCVAVGENPEKEAWFSKEERIALISAHTRALGNVAVEGYDGLTVDYVRRHGGTFMLRGIRDQTDLSNELQLANVNLIAGEIETLFLMTGDQHVLTSSTYIKQICELGGRDLERVRRLVPGNVMRALERKMRAERARGARR